MRTAEELGILPSQREALIELRDGFCRGDFSHQYDLDETKDGAKRLFNMNVWRSDSGCGTICCIGGWVEAITGTSFGEFQGYKAQNDPKLRSLFYPPLHPAYWGQITVKQAAAAINNYLEEGDPYWKEVFKK